MSQTDERLLPDLDDEDTVKTTDIAGSIDDDNEDDDEEAPEAEAAQ